MNGSGLPKEYAEGKQMWPFSDMSLATATTLGNIANAILLVSLLAGGIATFFVVQTTDVKERHWDSARDRAGERIAELTADGEKARAVLGTAQADIAKANAQIAEANARTAAAEAKLAETRQKLDIRRLDDAAFAARLNGVTPQKVLVSHSRGNPEALILSLPLVGALNRLGWEASYINDTSEEVEQCGRLGGIMVLARRTSAEEIGQMQNRKPKERSTPALALVDAIWEGVGENSASFATCPFIPEGVLQIAIGPKLLIFPK